MLFENWENVERVLLMGGAAYVALVIMLRLSGNRTLAKLSAFDLVVTVALGSTLATILLNRDVTLVEGVVAFLALIILQFVIAALSVRLPIVERFAKARPRPVLIDGALDVDAMRRARVTRAEILAAIRSAGFGEIEAIAAVVLETDGSLSVVARDRAGTRSALPGPSAK